MKTPFYKTATLHFYEDFTANISLPPISCSMCVRIYSMVGPQINLFCSTYWSLEIYMGVIKKNPTHDDVTSPKQDIRLVPPAPPPPQPHPITPPPSPQRF